MDFSKVDEFLQVLVSVIQVYMLPGLLASNKPELKFMCTFSIHVCIYTLKHSVKKCKVNFKIKGENCKTNKLFENINYFTIDQNI